MAPRRLALPLLLLSFLAAACAAPPAASTGPSEASTKSAAPSLASVAPTIEPAAYPITLTDDAGRDLELAAEPQRIVSLAPSNTEIVCALDACDRLVGVTDFDDFPASVADVEKVVIQATVDVELVVAAEPDLVLAAGNELTPSAIINQLTDLGLPVLVLYPESLDEVYGDIRLVGEALDRSTAADALVADMEDQVGEVVAAVEGAERPLTLYEIFHAEGTTYTAGEGSFLASLIELAGGEPLTGDAQGSIGNEELVAADPELILLGAASYDPSLGDTETALETVAARPGWGELRAVQDGAVVPYLEDIVTTRPGPRIVEGLAALARAIHPDLFGDAP
ncbi:MAG: ABC transporter substrate-binding protein [Chloroflexota bacterium]|nr:ABC transporter substrate-binding protein [Chloroflexota bacterium]